MWTLYSNQADARAVSPAELAALVKRDDVVFWLDLVAPERSELEAVAAILSLDSETIDDCLSGEQRPRVDDFDDYAFMVTYGMLGPTDHYEYSPRKLSIYCGKRYVITVHAENIRSIDMVRRRVEKQGGVLRGGPGDLLFTIFDQIVDNYILFVDHCELEVDRLEERSLKDDADHQILVESAELRTTLAEIRHLSQAADQALAAILADDFPFITADVGFDFHHVRDHLKGVAEAADRLRDRLNGVRDNLSFIIATRTNEIMRVLTVFASIMLPLSLVAGIYGMNLNLWPATENENGFWIVLAAMIALGGGLLLFFRRKKWL